MTQSATKTTAAVATKTGVGAAIATLLVLAAVKWQWVPDFSAEEQVVATAALTAILTAAIQALREMYRKLGSGTGSVSGGLLAALTTSALAAVLAACAYLEPAGRLAGSAVDAGRAAKQSQCTKPVEQRRLDLQAARKLRPEVQALDCDGDGLPDDLGV